MVCEESPLINHGSKYVNDLSVAILHMCEVTVKITRLYSLSWHKKRYPAIITNEEQQLRCNQVVTERKLYLGEKKVLEFFI